jgi:hypothetical protein
MLSSRGVLRHPKFDALVDAIAARQPRAAESINGAIWEIERNPTGCGFHVEDMDVWQARLVMHPPPDLLLYYTIAPRFVMMLTITTTDGSRLSP